MGISVSLGGPLPEAVEIHSHEGAAVVGEGPSHIAGDHSPEILHFPENPLAPEDLVHRRMVTIAFRTHKDRPFFHLKSVSRVYMKCRLHEVGIEEHD
jgi:hypothetical protein